MHIHPHRVLQWLGISPAELNNVTVDLTLIQPIFNQLWHQLREAGSFDERVRIVEKELPVLNDQRNQRSEQLGKLFRKNGNQFFQSVEELAKQVYYSPRQLNRVVHQVFGFSAEELIVYKKFIESVKLIHIQDSSLTSVAYEAGFYDQAHFCRVFKSYTGYTPNQYKKQKSHEPFHLYPAA
jgi:AraC-like DNA-binding protein